MWKSRADHVSIMESNWRREGGHLLSRVLKAARGSAWGMVGCGGIAWYWPDLGGGYRGGVRGPDSGEICEGSPFAEGMDTVVKGKSLYNAFQKHLETPIRTFTEYNGSLRKAEFGVSGECRTLLWTGGEKAPTEAIHMVH